MFSLFYGLIEYLFHKDELRVLIVGLDDAGKTTFLEKMKALYTNVGSLEADKIRPTVGLNIAKIDLFNSKLVFWDLGGANKLRTIWDKYYSETHGVIFVVDSANLDRFEEAKMALDKILASRELGGSPLLVLANKNDLEGSIDATEMTEHMGLATMRTAECNIRSINSLDGTGIHESITWLVSAIKHSARTAVLRNRIQ